jgi:hypothetical protein
MKTLTALVGLFFVLLVSNVLADAKLLPQRVVYAGHHADDFAP